MEIIREIVFYKHHFDDFFETLTDKVKDKIDEVLFMMTILERVPTKFFKSIEGVKGLFEIRVEYESNIYRIFCCFDKRKFSSSFQWISKENPENTNKRIKQSLKNNGRIF